MTVRVLIVDDHEPVRLGIRSLLARREDWSVCGEATDGLEATEMARQLRPDVVLMDISMPRMDGLQATGVILRELSDAKIILVSQNDPRVVRQQVAEIGAHGCIAKMDLARDLLSVIERVVDHHQGTPATLSESPPVGSPPTSPTWFEGGGEMGDLMRATDWSKTLLGPAQSWSPALRMMVKFLLANRFPQLLWWGPDFCSLYNDAYIPILGAKHPWALGQPVRDVWHEIWHILKPLVETPYHGGPATWMEDIPLEINRLGFFEETHFTIAYSPVPDETVPGGIGGVLATVHEITEKLIGERRVSILSDLAARSIAPKSAEEACTLAAETLSRHPKDFPFVLFYLLNAKRQAAQFICGTGVDPNDPGCQKIIDLTTNEGTDIWSVSKALETEEIQIVENLADKFQNVPPGPWTNPPTTAAVVPVRSSVAHQLAGFLIVGLSSRIRYEQKYRDFLVLMASQIATSIANARAYEEERRRAEALAEIDRAKTLFFSNVSHEFRTPLTLMLGPLEDTLAASRGLSPDHLGRLHMAHRNSLRLLKLVNTLLDFSRIEAGRVQAVYEPTDLGTFTTELASMFESATQRASLRLIINSPPLSEPVYVDREMWEKIVLNLLSNAFKFTFSGEIEVTLQMVDGFAQLTIRDTGTGIPEQELPHLFERFHRVKGARGRTFEGSGIGLSLVQELAKLHGGSVHVQSELNRGSSFTVRVPLGKEHLPESRIGAARSLESTALRGEAYVQEALRWLPADETVSDEVPATAQLSSAESRPHSKARTGSAARILLADDNADLREYVQKLLLDEFEVVAVSDGEAALRSARERRPDLILSDIMMPQLDGFGLLAAVRADESLKRIPVILLSARAGEESRVEGLHSGADDYLVKPFSARELLARVRSHLTMTRIREQSEETLARRAAELADSEQRLRLSTDAAELGIWHWQFDQPHGVWENDRMYEIYGRSREDGPITNDEFYAKVCHPDDAQALQQAVEESLKSGSRFFSQCRIYRKDGSLRHVEYTGQIERRPDGTYHRMLGTAVDITDRKRAEEALRQSEERFRAIVDTTPECVKLVAADGTLLYMNLPGLQMVGAPSAEAVFGKSVFDLIAPEDRDRYREFNERICSGGRSSLEFDIVGLTGTRRHMETHAAPLRNPYGATMQLAVSHDITERSHAERTKALLAAIVDTSDDAIVSKNLQGVITSWNKGAERIFGYSAEEAIGQSIRLIIPPDRHDEEVDILARIRRGESINHFETIRCAKDGRLLNISVTISPVKDSSGRIVGASKVARDITHRKQAEERERQIISSALEANAKFRAVFEQTTVFAGIMTKDGVLIDANKSCLEVCGYRSEDVLGKPFWEGPWWRAFSESQEKIRAATPLAAQGIPYREMLRYSWADATERLVEFALYPIMDQNGEILFLHPTGVDITDLKRVEEKYRNLAQTLEAEVHARTLELEERNAEVLHQSEQLRELSWRLLRAQDNERRHIARELHDSAGQTLAVLALNLAQLQDETQQSSQEASRLVAQTDELVRQLTQEIRTTSYLLHPPLLDETGLAPALRWYVDGLRHRSGLEISLDIPEPFERLSEGVELMIFRLVQECLTNIHRHSGSKTATIRVARDDGAITVEVRDQGKGITPEKLAQIQSQGGVGIRGMRERVLQFHGQLTIESNPDGTRIYAAIPIPLKTSSEDQSTRSLPAAV
jgi:PAS domain S-box-containing protein